MTREEARSRIERITVWRRRGERAPHKPLLVLLALAKCSRGEDRLISFSEVNRRLDRLLREFGPSRKSYHPEYPFWRLQNDSIWEVTDANRLQRRRGNSDALKSELLRLEVRGGFTEEFYGLLRTDPQLLAELANAILSSHFPDSIYADILSAVGLEIDLRKRSHRDPAFREKVLRAYEFKCAVCGFDVRIDQRTICLEAAHVKWWQEGGSDEVANGMALCTMHHKMLDMGAYRLSDDRRVIVSERVNGSTGVSEWLLSFNGRKVRNPVRFEYSIDHANIGWHVREVFKGYPRPTDEL